MLEGFLIKEDLGGGLGGIFIVTKHRRIFAGLWRLCHGRDSLCPRPLAAVEDLQLRFGR